MASFCEDILAPGRGSNETRSDSVERDLEELLSFLAVPAAHWKTVRTTNVIERAFREVRRRTRPMSSFINPASCDRIVFGVISDLTAC